MKTLLLTLLLTQQAPTPAMKCVEWKAQTKTVCERASDHTLGGAAVGYLIFGPLGAVVGAVAGHDNKESCHEEDTGARTCVRYEAVKP